MLRLMSAQKARKTLLLSAGLLLLLVLLSLMPPGAASRQPSEASSPAHTPPLTPREQLERVRQEFVPAGDSATTYGVRFNEEGYRTLLAWRAQYKVSQTQATAFESLDVRLPCCAFGRPSADEASNCACGHHQALYGLSKRLFSLGYNAAATQAEVELWSAYFFPRETLQAVLEEKAATDPAMQQALDELQQNGGC